MSYTSPGALKRWQYLRSVGGMWPERSFRPVYDLEPERDNRYFIRSVRMKAKDIKRGPKRADLKAASLTAKRNGGGAPNPDPDRLARARALWRDERNRVLAGLSPI